MKFISEQESRRLVSHEIAYNAVKEAFIAAATDQASNVFPAIIAHAAQAQNVFSLESGTTSDVCGLKVGSYWPGNAVKNAPNHNSTILLIDQDNGKIASVIEAGEVNAYRTAAANAVAASVLARPESSTLAVFGAGRQALYECLALVRVLPITQIMIVARDSEKGQALVEKLLEHKLPASLALSGESACSLADVVVTATPSRASLVESHWIKPGTHIACMGADSKGKHEIASALLDSGRLFCDLPAQSRVIGEFQHAAPSTTIQAIGDVLSEKALGRLSGDDITIFDSSGIALQDLLIAQRLVDAAENAS